jgi:DHA1 family bicyclomycin/chloramphenicol resistance-like MFS transporter
VSAVDEVIDETVTSAPSSSSPSPRLIALPFALALVMVSATYWSVDIVSPALPDMQDDLELNAASVGLIYSLLFLGRLLGNFPAAYLLGRIGTAGTAAAGGLVLVVGSLLGSIATSGLWLSPARMLQGAGIAFLVNACLRAIMGARPGRGAAMTYFSFAATVGGLLGLQSGGYLTEEMGWRSVFVMGSVIAGIIAATAIISRFNGRRAGGAVDLAQVRHVAAAEGSGSLIPPLIFNFLVFVNYSLFVALPLYTERVFDASPETNARLLMVITVTHLVAAFPAGRMIRSWGAQKSLVAGMIVALVGTGLIFPAPSPAWIALPLILYGIGQVAASSAGGDIVLHLGGQSARSVSMVRFSSDFGLVVGPYATGVISDQFGYRAPFVALPIMMGVAVLFAFYQSVTDGARRV